MAKKKARNSGIRSWLTKNRDQIIISIIGSVGSAILIGILFGFPKYILDNWNTLEGRISFWTREPLKVEIVRSLVNHDLILTTNPDGTVNKFVVTGEATSYQLHLNITNRYGRPLLIKDLKLYGSNKDSPMIESRMEIILKDSESKIFLLPHINLWKQKDSSMILSSLLSGKLELKITTEYGSKNYDLNSITFFGVTQSGIVSLYLAGDDSSSMIFELRNPEGLYHQTKGFTQF